VKGNLDERPGIFITDKPIFSSGCYIKSINAGVQLKRKSLVVGLKGA
jgi:hypothetical protein